jgi:hypothetical protein
MQSAVLYPGFQGSRLCARNLNLRELYSRLRSLTLSRCFPQLPSFCPDLLSPSYSSPISIPGEYGVECRMEPLGYSLARWVGGGWDAIERADKVRESVKLML